jgi:hypothetical protein
MERRYTDWARRRRTIVIRIQLSKSEADRLEQAFHQATDRKRRDRLQIIRLAHRGRPPQDIAADLAITPRTVPRWLHASRDRGLDGLRPRQAKGRPRRSRPTRPPRSAAGSARGRPRQGSTEPTGPRPHWLTP